MADKVYILNKNVYPLREMFKGLEVTIEPNDFWRDKAGNKKEFDLFEANDFRGQYRPVPMDGSGKMLGDAKYFKMIEMVPVDGGKDKSSSAESSYRCMAKDCKHVSPSPEELEAHTNMRHPNIEKLILPDEDSRLPAKKSKLA